MKVILMLICLIPIQLKAEILRSQVFKYEENHNHVKFSNGRIAKAGKINFKDLVGKTVEVNISEKNVILNHKVLYIPPLEMSFNFLENTPASFEPSVLPNLDAAQEMFDRLDSDYIRRSECTDRAHVWAFDEYKKHGINTMKAFIFFTASYINKNNFKWWFHVAPMIKVNENGKIVDRILDYQFLDRPVTVKEWTDLQVHTKRDCKVTTKFSEYDVNPQTEDCYMIYESMYYRLPGDIYAQELRNEFKSSFSESEVNFARKTGFKKTRIGAENE